MAPTTTAVAIPAAESSTRRETTRSSATAPTVPAVEAIAPAIASRHPPAKSSRKAIAPSNARAASGHSPSIRSRTSSATAASPPASICSSPGSRSAERRSAACSRSMAEPAGEHDSERRRLPVLPDRPTPNLRHIRVGLKPGGEHLESRPVGRRVDRLATLDDEHQLDRLFSGPVPRLRNRSEHGQMRPRSEREQRENRHREQGSGECRPRAAQRPVHELAQHDRDHTATPLARAW